MAKLDFIVRIAKSNLKVASVATAVIVSALVVLMIMDRLTEQRIVHNEQAWLEAQILTLIPQQTYDNNLMDDRKEIIAQDYFGNNIPAVLFRARLHGLPTGAVIRSTTNEGYGGPIDLLVAVNYDGEVLGTRILSHHETPNIGNAFEWPGSQWLNQFIGRSASNTGTKSWNIRKDGGEFDQFTSASITPRAIIKAVQHTVEFYRSRRDDIYAP